MESFDSRTCQTTAWPTFKSVVCLLAKKIFSHLNRPKHHFVVLQLLIFASFLSYPMNFLCLTQIHSYLCFRSCSVLKWLALNLIQFLNESFTRRVLFWLTHFVDWKTLLSIYFVCQFRTILPFFTYYSSGSLWIRWHSLAVMTVIDDHLNFSQILLS